jgi:fucose 4-O-acetylase-like acetyltransferase
MTAISESARPSAVSTPERILFLDSLRATAVIMVIAFHAMGYCLPLPYPQREVISFIVYSVSVPVFFLVDGYLFARSAILGKGCPYCQTVRNNLFRLLVPWAFFTAFYTLARYCLETTGFFEENLTVGHSWREVAISAYVSLYAPQMYFLASLFLIRLCGPAFKKLALAKNGLLVLLLFFGYYAIYRSCIPFIAPYLNVHGGQEPVLHALWGTQYYLAGLVLFRASRVRSLDQLFVTFLLLFLASLPIAGSLGGAGPVIVQYLYLITLFLCFLRVGNRLPLLARIGKNTMGIYLIHAPIVLKGVSLIVNKLVPVPLWNFLAVLLGTFLLTIAIVALVNFIPYGVLLFGTRPSTPPGRCS